MKTLKFLAASLLIMTFAACEKSATLDSDLDKQNTNPTENIQYAQTSAGVKVECTGSECTDGTEGCWMSHHLPTNTVNCCEGCSMVITMGVASVLDEDLLDHIEHVQGNFEDYVESNYPNADVGVNTIEVTNFEDEFVLIKYEYTNITEGFVSSVAYRVNFDQGAVANKFEIDCSGGCNSEGASCSESYNLNTGDVSCTCEGSCNMTVTQLPSE